MFLNLCAVLSVSGLGTRVLNANQKLTGASSVVHLKSIRIAKRRKSAVIVSGHTVLLTRAARFTKKHNIEI